MRRLQVLEEVAESRVVIEYPLGPPGRAGGIDDVGEVVGLHRTYGVRIRLGRQGWPNVVKAEDLGHCWRQSR